MGRQKGILQFQGSVGALSFYKGKDGFMVREKTGIDAKRFATDPSFQRTRENSSEFGRAAKAGKLLRTAFRGQIQNAMDSGVVGRLTQQMMAVIQEDKVSTRGQRNVIDGEAALLQGFEFNVTGKLTTSLFASFDATIDRVTGDCIVNLPSFIPSQLIAATGGTTHFKIISAAAAIDFENVAFVVDNKETAVLPWDNTATAIINLSNSVGANSTHPIFLVLGISFFQEVNGMQYPLKNGAFNPLAIVKVEGL
ncbi:MAG: hypothetical protein WCH78_10885 [Bacteroidota bacterium]|jgi:hypothetical protein